MKSSLRGTISLDPFISGILAEVDRQFSAPCRDKNCRHIERHNVDDHPQLEEIYREEVR